MGLEIGKHAIEQGISADIAGKFPRARPVMGLSPGSVSQPSLAEEPFPLLGQVRKKLSRLMQRS